MNSSSGSPRFCWGRVPMSFWVRRVIRGTRSRICCSPWWAASYRCFFCRRHTTTKSPNVKHSDYTMPNSRCTRRGPRSQFLGSVPLWRTASSRAGELSVELDVFIARRGGKQCRKLFTCHGGHIILPSERTSNRRCLLSEYQTLNSSQRYLKFFLRLIMVDRSDDVEGHTRTRERMAHGNVYALERRPDRVCVSLFRPYRD